MYWGLLPVGVGSLRRSVNSSPDSVSTMAPLMPVPPMSIPTAMLMAFLQPGLCTTAVLGMGQDVGAGLRDREGVLELGRPALVACRHCPAVVPLVPLVGAESEHGFDREDH